MVTTLDQHEAGGVAGRTVLITGASSGIGKATAKRMLMEDYSVYAAARRVEQMRDLEDLGAIALKMDVTNEEDVVAGVERINAEQGARTSSSTTPASDCTGRWRTRRSTTRGTSSRSPVRGGEADPARPSLHARSGRGKDCERLLGRWENLYPAGSWYYATKHALEGWSDCLRWELKHFGIDVSSSSQG